MTEYWKSQARKYCDFCKCWLADNKVSISFHENGKRHKENVQNHISKLSKKSAKDYKQKEKMDDEIKKMEAAAMAAYLKDVENNADMTSQSINAMLGNSTSKEEASSSTTNPRVAPVAPVAAVAKSSKPLWHEIESENGNYFWNTETNETTWDTPDEYLSLKQQEEQTLKEQEKLKQNEKAQKAVKKQKQKESAKEARANAAREQMRERAAQEPAPPAVSFGPAPFAAKPYGKWTAVVETPVEKVDLQLPKKHIVLPPVVMQPEERPSFQEKRVESLGEGPVEFKRRKINNPKRNMRQKVDDD